MSDENLNGNNDDNDNQEQAHQQRLPLQPDIGLGLERSNNESRRSHNIEPSSGSGSSVSFSHFLGRPPGASNAGLPDFVQDHLADIPYNLNQSRSSCDNANPTLPDFLSDTQRSVNSPDPPSSLSSSNNLVSLEKKQLKQLQLENDNLRREMENLRRLLAQQHALILRLERDQAIAASSSQNISSSHSQSVAALQQEVDTLRAENRALKQGIASSEATPASHVRPPPLLSRELRNQATRSEHLLRGLMGAVSSMKELADQIAAQNPADSAEAPRDYREVPSDSEDD